jgi:hypothetical protein
MVWAIGESIAARRDREADCCAGYGIAGTRETQSAPLHRAIGRVRRAVAKRAGRPLAVHECCLKDEMTC